MTQLQLLCRGPDVVVDFDIDGEGRLATITHSRESFFITVEGSRWSSGRLDAEPHVRHIRWLSPRTVVVWSYKTSPQQINSVRSLTAAISTGVPVGAPSDILCGADTLFVMYGEEHTIRGDPTIESSIIAVTKGDGTFITGLRDFIDALVTSEIPLEVTRSCVTALNELVFTVYSTKGLWVFSASRGALTRRALSLRLDSLAAMSCDAGNVYLAYKTTDQIEFECLEEGSDAPVPVGSLSFSGLLRNSPADETVSEHIRIRGLLNGKFGISAGNAVWVASMF